MFDVKLLFFQHFDKKSSPPTQYLILNKNVNENDDADDVDYKFFWNKKNTKKIRVPEFGGRGINKGFWPEYLPLNIQYQNKESIYLKSKELELAEPVLKNNYQINTYKKGLSRPHFNDEPKNQEKQQVQDQQSCIFVFVARLSIPTSN